MSSAPCLAGVFSLCFFLFVTIWVTSLGSILRSCYFAEFSITQCFRGPQMVRYASAFKPAPARAHSSGCKQAEECAHDPKVCRHPRPHDDIGKRQILNPLRFLQVVPATKRHCPKGPRYAGDSATTTNHCH